VPAAPRENALPLVSSSLAALCVWTQTWLAILAPAAAHDLYHAAGLIPAVLVGRAVLPPDLAWWSPPWTLLTSLAAHAEWSAWALNLIGFAAFGPALERAMRRRNAVCFLLACGVGGALASVVAQPAQTVPALGAGAMVAGLASAAIMLHPRAHRALAAAGWLLVALGLAWFRPSGTPGLGVPALVAGALMGAGLLVCLKYPDQPVLAA
jgi:membrane associated rhomboid family serine protease